jgi:hypothetical protein
LLVCGQFLREESILDIYVRTTMSNLAMTANPNALAQAKEYVNEVVEKMVLSLFPLKNHVPSSLKLFRARILYPSITMCRIRNELISGSTVFCCIALAGFGSFYRCFPGLAPRASLLRAFSAGEL